MGFLFSLDALGLFLDGFVISGLVVLEEAIVDQLAVCVEHLGRAFTDALHEEADKAGTIWHNHLTVSIFHSLLEVSLIHLSIFKIANSISIWKIFSEITIKDNFSI